MKKYFFVGLGLVLALTLLVVAYGAYLNERGESQIALRMEERQAELIGEKAARRAFHPLVKFSAVNLYTASIADAVALTEGRIVEAYASVNSYVHKGDLLFRLENDNIALSIQEAEASIMSANAELARATNNYDRYSKLLQVDAASSQQFDEAKAAYVAAQANLQAAVAKRDMLLVNESRCEVRAPIDGTVRIIYRQPGTYVPSGTSLALVGDYNELYFSHQVSDDKAQRLQVGQEAEFIFPGREFKNLDGAHGDMGTEQVFHGVLTEIAPPLEVPGAARTLLWRIDNPLGLLTPQTYGTAYLKLVRGAEALCVPLSALTDKTRQTVFVYRDGKLERRDVVTGRDDGDYVEILGGLEPGEIVIVFGTENLQDGLKAEVKLRGEQDVR